MGFIRRLIRGEALTIAQGDPGEPLVGRLVGPEFSLSVDIDPGTLYGVPSAAEAIAQADTRRVTRAQAISVPAIKRARDLVCAAIGSLPLKLYGPDGKAVEWDLLSQPEQGIASVITWTNVGDDLFFDGTAWLAVRAYGWHGLPAQVLRLEPSGVSVPQHTITVHTRTGSGTAQVYAPDELLIRIDSPMDPLLVAGARAVRTLLRLEQAALNAADGVPPADYFAPETDDSNPFADEDDEEAEAEEVKKFLDSWTAARRQRRTGWVPPGLKYETNSISPKDLQLVEAREMAITEIARLTGVDPEDLAVSTTSRTYANMQDRRRERLDFTLGPLARAIESRLSMDDVTPPGYTVRFDTAAFLAPDDKTAAETDQLLIEAAIEGVDEVRARRSLPPRSVAAPATDQPKELTS